MGVAKKTRKFAQTKRVIGRRQAEFSKVGDGVKNKAANGKPDGSGGKGKAAKTKGEVDVKHIPQEPTHMFFNANTALGPPYSVLVDTNFIALSVRGKLDLLSGLMDLLFAKCNICVTDCCIAELEKLGPRYSLALKLARSEKWQRLPCDHKVYADDCIVERVLKHRVYLVGTNDRNLKGRLRKIPGCPLLSVGRGKYVIERLPEAL